MIRAIVERLTLLQRFIALCLAALVVFGIILGLIVTATLEQNMVTRSKQTTAAIVRREVVNEFTPTASWEPKTGPDYDVFTAKVGHLTFGPDVVRIKVWNKGKFVVWSDDRRLVGEQFLDNDELIAALNGEIVSEISRLDKKEQQFEVDFQRLLELYVPVKFENQSSIEVVFEVYQNLDPLYADISANTRTVWILIAAGFSLLFAVLVGIVGGASRRITRQNQDIIRSEEKYRSLVDSAQDAIVSIDSSGTMVLFNEAAQKVFGYSTEEAVGKSVIMLLPEHYRTSHQLSLERVLQSTNSTIAGNIADIEGLKKDGQHFPMELSLSVSGIDNNRIITEIIRDISERKVMQAQLVEAEKQASVSLIAGSIGHELNNVVTSLKGFAELLQKTPGDKQLAEECAGVFAVESQRLQTHARNLLSLSKPQKPDMKQVFLNIVIDRVTELLVVSGLLKSFSVVKDYSVGLPPVLADEMQLEQVIRNLEINAAHAMGNGGKLTLGTRTSKDASVEFWITDTGHGIPEDKREQIFVPFYTTKEKGKGTGLGMYIIKKTVEQHGGYINVESKVGAGTTITVGIPLAQ